MAFRTALAERATAVAVLLPLAAWAGVIQVDSRSQGRTFFVDTDRPEIRKALVDVAAPPRAGSIPEWLPPYPGAAFVERPSPHDPPDFAHASYRSAAAPDEVFAHYESALRA